MNRTSYTSLVRYRFADEKSFWCPTVDFSRSVRYGDSMQVVFYKFLLTPTGEEWFHRHSMINTKVRLHMAWEEALSSRETLIILSMLMKLSERDRSFDLQIPLRYNLRNPKIPLSLKMHIRDLEKACGTIYSLGETCRPFTESLVLVQMRMLLDRVLPRRKSLVVFRRLKQAKFRNDASLRQVYPKMEKAISYMQFDDWLSQLVHCLFSPRSLCNTPPLTLSDSFMEFNEEYVSKIRKRFFRFLDKMKKPLLNSEDFLKFARYNKLEYMDDDEINEVFPAYETSCRFFSEDYKDNFVIVDTSLRTIKRTDDFFQIFLVKFDQDAGAEFLAEGVSSLFVWETMKGTVNKLAFRLGLDKRTASKLVHADGTTFLKYFLLNWRWECPFFNCFKSCESCFVDDLKKKKKLTIYAFDCPVGESLPFTGMNVTLVD